MTEDCILWRGFSTNGHLVRERGTAVASIADGDLSGVPARARVVAPGGHIAARGVPVAVARGVAVAPCVSAPAPVVGSAIVTCEAFAIAATEMTATEMGATEWATEVRAGTKMGAATEMRATEVRAATEREGAAERKGAEREG
jgi:hypothetical protein